MNLFSLIAILLTLAALASYLNHRFIGLPCTVGIMLISLVFSLLLVGASQLGLGLQAQAERMLGQIDFSAALLNGMLSFLLFAGSLHVELKHLQREKWSIAFLATVGVMVSTLLVAGMMHWAFGWLGLGVALLPCLILGALISPTDPIAVLALLKQARAPDALATRIAGESLFNDGVGVVIFLVFYELLTSGEHLDWGHAGLLLLREAAGGIVLGLVLGWITYRLLKSVDQYQVEVLLTLALVTGGYALATTLHVSGPLAIVAAGLLIGNPGRRLAMSDRTRERLDTFWELVDEILNAVLFVLIGLEVLVLKYQPGYLAAALLAVPAVLLARWVSAGAPVMLLRAVGRPIEPYTVRIMTWGGLRGGISVALALSLPASPERDLLLMVTYGVVVFSILVQGLTMPWLLRRAFVKTDG